jgi:hypothetical protein
LKSGSDQIQNYCLKSFPDAHRPVTINLYSIMEGLEKVPDWPNTGITYLLSKSGESQEISNYRPISCLTAMYQILRGPTARRISTLWKRRTYYQRSRKDNTLEVKGAMINSRYQNNI